MKDNSIKRMVKSVVPQPIITGTRNKVSTFKKGIQSLWSNRNKMVPPEEMIFIGYGDFIKIGEEFKQYFVEIGGLKPTDHVLDVGCGIGRMAIPLTGYMAKKSRYEGIDIVAKGIDWCNQKITPRFPNFRFQLADVYNQYYHPEGKFQPSEYKFPFEDNTFDFVFLTSVFTHMLPADMENYLSEISRVLRANGKCMITWFLLNNESMDGIEKKESNLDFKFERDNYRYVDRETPELAIAYPENCIRPLYEKYRLKLVEPIQFGSWCGRNEYLSFQDIILAEKV